MKTISYTIGILTGIILCFGFIDKKQELNLQDNEKNTISVFQKTSSQVVNVRTKKYTRINMFSHDVRAVPSGSGSGFIWDSQGHIVTNYHVVKNAHELTVSFGSNEIYNAKVIGLEAKKDIAVLKIVNAKNKSFTGLSLGNSAHLLVGQKVIAIGSPFGFDQTLTTGIVSATGRAIMGIGGVTIRDMIQTDASINPGNSGGPLLDSQANLIGMTTMIYSRSGSSAGVGFAVPVNTIERVVEQIIKFGRVKQAGFGLHLVGDHISRKFNIRGVIIEAVKPGTEAEKAGFVGLKMDSLGRLILGDIILAIDGETVASYDDLYNLLETKKIGSFVTVKILRNKKEKWIKTKLIDVGLE